MVRIQRVPYRPKSKFTVNFRTWATLVFVETRSKSGLEGRAKGRTFGSSLCRYELNEAGKGLESWLLGKP